MRQSHTGRAQDLADPHHLTNHHGRGRLEALLLDACGERCERADHRPLSREGTARDHRGGGVGIRALLEQPGRDLPKAERPISTTSVGTRASASQSRSDTPSHSCPVTTAKADASRRWVTGIPAAAGTAIADVTPGTTRNATPAARRASHSSAPRPNTKGSPPLSRTTVSPRRARSTNNALISLCARSASLLCGRFPTNTRSAPGGASVTKTGATRRSYTTTSADRRISSPFAV